MLLSILVATLDARRASFEALRAELMRQIGEREDVELLWEPDDGELAVGAKRNALVRRARGAYVCFVDDDDEVHSRYVELVTAALATRPDCVAITVEMRFREGAGAAGSSCRRAIATTRRRVASTGARRTTSTRSGARSRFATRSQRSIATRTSTGRSPSPPRASCATRSSSAR